MSANVYVVVELPGGASQEIPCEEVTESDRGLLLSGCMEWDDCTPEGFGVPDGGEVHVPHSRVVAMVYPDD